VNVLVYASLVLERKAKPKQTEHPSSEELRSEATGDDSTEESP
jgi:hypothetical protein